MIVLGYGFAKTNIIDAAASRGIGLFVFNVAIPALLFKTMATMDTKDVAPWNLWAAFYGGIALTCLSISRIFRVKSVQILAFRANMRLVAKPKGQSEFFQKKIFETKRLAQCR